MDKETLSNYGWIVICTLVLAVMIALATPFGEYVKAGVESTVNGLYDVNNKAMDVVYQKEKPKVAGLTFSDGTFLSWEEAKAKYSGKITDTTIKQRTFGITNSTLVSVVIPDTVTTIENSAFGSCKSLNDVFIPESVTTIGNAAFGSCSSLKIVNLPSSLTLLSEALFSGCSSLESVNIPQNIKSIGPFVFDNCSSLKKLIIPEGVTTIGNSAFRSCSSLKEINIPSTVTSIGNDTFIACSTLSKVNITDLSAWCNISFSNDSSNPLYCAHNLYLNNELITDLVIPNEVTEIKSYAFDSGSFSNVIISEGVTTIGYSSFSYVTLLSSISLPTSLTSIKNVAFYGATIPTVMFAGTRTQWNAVSKGTQCFNTANTVQFVCSDD